MSYPPKYPPTPKTMNLTSSSSREPDPLHRDPGVTGGNVLVFTALFVALVFCVFMARRAGE